ncbi:hypothetical protein C8C83_2263 [Flavobacterium sp. 90]|nr:hypothetical protein C8C82_2568 [Flavobacterium sp. 81]TCK54370.1 hypothetical protein C8C83_2263 [Flavobacterium sp. 90]
MYFYQSRIRKTYRVGNPKNKLPMKKLQELSKSQKLSKEELKSINAGNGTPCIPWPLCNGQEATFETINSCGWYLYRTASNSICMEYGAV